MYGNMHPRGEDLLYIGKHVAIDFFRLRPHLACRYLLIASKILHVYKASLETERKKPNKHYLLIWRTRINKSNRDNGAVIY